MTLNRVKSVAELGLNYISVGALTHSAPRADVSLLFDWEG
jgi:nicotinate-nucleotide pyrophosphorylase (carboxylating)